MSYECLKVTHFCLVKNDSQCFSFNSVTKVSRVTLADLGRAPEGPPTAQNFLNFMQFFGKFWQNHMLTLGAPSYGESWIRPWVRIEEVRWMELKSPTIYLTLSSMCNFATYSSSVVTISSTKLCMGGNFLLEAVCQNKKVR